MKPEYTQMVRDLAKPPADIIVGLTPVRTNILHAMLGLTDEILELGEALANRDIANILEELGDVLFYNEMLGQEIGVTMQDIERELRNFTLEGLGNIDHLMSMAGEAVTFAKRIGIYCKEYSNEDLKFFYIRVNMLMMFVGKEFGDDLKDHYYDIHDEERNPISTFDAVQNHNMHKLLQGRYKSGLYSDEQANARADKAAE